MPKGYIVATNPATDEAVAKYKLMSIGQALSKLRQSRVAYARWSKTPLTERGELLRNLARVIRSKKTVHAKLITTEMGKPISQSEAEIEKCAWTAEVYAENAQKWLEDELGSTDAQLSYVTFQPLGVILSMMPWNFPFWQVFRFAIPALVAGNTTVLRHSNVCPGSSVAIREAFREAGFPEGVFDSVITDHDSVAKMIKSEFVQGVSFTGSVEAGRRVGELAAKNLTKAVLELGGSDPFIILGDADVKKAAQVGANARLICSGQSCIAAKRFIAVTSVAKEFSQAFVEEFAKKKVGDPMDPQTDVGPLANRAQVATLHSQVKDAISKGASLAMGGKPGDGVGAFYELTVLEGANPAMRVMNEEVFGPVAPIHVVLDQETAIRTANNTGFGLGASVWTNDAARAKQVAAEIESGIVFVNELVKSDPRMPFGGIKNSGIGRELSRFGLREFTNTKSVNIFGMSESELARYAAPSLIHL